jgi:hypothetical protein
MCNDFADLTWNNSLSLFPESLQIWIHKAMTLLEAWRWPVHGFSSFPASYRFTSKSLCFPRFAYKFWSCPSLGFVTLRLSRSGSFLFSSLVWYQSDIGDILVHLHVNVLMLIHIIARLGHKLVHVLVLVHVLAHIFVQLVHRLIQRYTRERTYARTRYKDMYLWSHNKHA